MSTPLSGPAPQPAAPASIQAVAHRCDLVLDTNTVLDGWLFGDGAMQTWRRAIEDGRLRWVATQAMTDELRRVLERPLPARWEDARIALLARAPWDWPQRVGPVPTLCLPALRSRDADDQVFIDLAVAHRVRWLLSRDRALLRLARAAAVHGVRVTQPAQAQPEG